MPEIEAIERVQAERAARAERLLDQAIGQIRQARRMLLPHDLRARPVVKLRCAVCEDTFEALASRHWATTCSNRCRTQMKLQRAAGAHQPWD